MKPSTNTFELSGQIIDLVKGIIFQGSLRIEHGIITEIRKEEVKSTHYILPGLIDSHVHIESSMLVPSEFARLAVVHGTVATVSDPHEIANVLGIEGIKYMIDNGKTVPFKFFFGASSCVPATGFETAGAVLGVDDIETLLKLDEIKYLAEMMNYPGVIYEDKEVMAKLALAVKYNKPVDGHAPGLMGEDVKKYISAGITTDHECFTMEEALAKIEHGMKIQIREGSAAKNFDALIDLLETHPDSVLFCSDDKHPNDLVRGHINEMIKRAIQAGYDPMKVLQCCILNPIKHYNLEIGKGQQGDPADLIVVDNLTDFTVLQTYVNGIKVAENGKSLINPVKAEAPNRFVAAKVVASDFSVPYSGKKIRVIEALEGQLITNTIIATPKVVNGKMVSDTENDILKITVINRYQKSAPAIAFIRNFGLKKGAIASTVAHDSHNIIAIGADDESLAKAVNLLIENTGGISVVSDDSAHILPLPVAGLMSNGNGYQTASAYEQIDAMAKQLGTTLHAPFMTLSFMALLVIPQLKISDLGLFDGATFSFTELEVEEHV
ncbi:MAG: adenine deaminase [Bacteroidales bacterium]|nr:adenine deaminase [Bacteroidales bacterium]